MKKYILILILIGLIQTIHAQYLAEYTSLDDSVSFHSLTKVGSSYLIAGNINNDLLLIAVAANGNFLSGRQITIVDNSVGPVASSIMIDADGYVVVAGFRGTGGTTTGFVLKYNYVMSTVVWCQHYNNPNSVFLKIIETTSTGPYLAVGQNDITTSNTAEDGLVMAINRTSGAFTVFDNSEETTTTLGPDTYYSIIRNGANLFAPGRLTYATSTAKMRPALIEFNGGGRIGQSTYLRNTTTDNARLYATDITRIDDEMYSAVWGDYDNTVLFSDLFILKQRPDLSLIWSNQYDLTDFALDGRWNSIRANLDDELIVLGSLFEDTNIDDLGDVMLASLDSNGTVNWFNSYPFEINNIEGHPDAMFLNNDTIRVVGTTINSAADDVGVLMKVAMSDGDLFDCETPLNWDVIDTPDETYTPTLAAVTGTVTPTEIDPDDVALTLDDVLICYDFFESRFEQSHTIIIDDQADDINIYPNPSNGVIFISFKNATPAEVEIFNSAGKFIEHISTETGSEIQLNNYAQGIYFLKCSINDLVYFKSFVID